MFFDRSDDWHLPGLQAAVEWGRGHRDNPAQADAPDGSVPGRLARLILASDGWISGPA